ncbi:hypothetical protein CWE12_12935 [Aliidiomarina sedimenti]|uniref:Uncharacterized protein n=1 Tax=Aliidiomarina sedimenti TaxID=1933879 RepID=A0ABY0BVA9_9GAMM|nr:hypothetical protein [Aliidiomarina sedimenti]RUO28120.1 hypothetical protein CWE12_12935 [Aliidiomarina sedimenti]
MKVIVGTVSVLVIVVLSVFIFNRQQGPWSLIAEQLAVAESGQMIEIENDQLFISHFSFFTDSDSLCRVYSVGGDGSMNEQLACFDPEQGWLTFIEFQRVRAERDDEFEITQHASGSRTVNQKMGELGAGPTLSLEEERNALRQLQAE